MRSGFIVAACLAVAVAVASAADASGVTITLQRLGKPAGLVFESSEGEQTLYFPEPRDVNVTARTLLLRYRSSPLMKEPSNLRVRVNGVPVKSVSLAPGSETPMEVAIPLEYRPTPGTRMVKVTIAVSARISLEKCVDDHLRAGFVHILPDSGVHFATDGAPPATVRAVADHFGNEVVVSLSAQHLTEEAFSAAWRIADWLWRTKRKVRFTHLPEAGDIIVASAEEVASALPDFVRPNTQPGVPANVSVRYRPDGTKAVLAVSEPFRIGAELLEPDWIGVAQGAQYLTRPARAADRNLPHKLALRLGGLTLEGDSLQESPERTEWQVRIGANELPPHYRMRRIALEWITAPRLHSQPQMIHVYRNEALIQSIRLPDDGTHHRYTVELPDNLAGRENYFRIVSQRLPYGGECETKGVPMPIELLPGTTFFAELEKQNPLNLDEAAEWLRSGFTLYLDPDYLRKPETILPFLGQMTSALNLPVDRAHIAVFTPGRAFNTGPFLLVSQHTPGGMLTPVRFDRGRVEVLDARGNVLLDSGGLPGIAVAQLAQFNNHFGVWLRPSDRPLPDEGFRPELGDALFLDQSGLVRAVNSRALDETRLRYPQFTDWLDALRRYRYWLFGSFWILLTLGFVQLYRKLSRSKGIA